MNSFKIGDKVVLKETAVSSFNYAKYPAITTKDYQNLLKAAIDKIGTVKEYNLDLSWVAFPEGWQLRIPTEFLTLQSTMNQFNIGDKVIFDKNKIETFKSETNDIDAATDDYQKLVLAGAELIGLVKKYDTDLTWITYPDGWDLPLPTKYLIKI